MGHAEAGRRLAVAALMSTILACGGVTVEPLPSAGGASNDGGSTSGRGGSGDASGRGGTGGRGGGAGAVPSAGGSGGALADCKSPVVQETACPTPGAHCGGPCSNSWQVENVCQDGAWNYAGVVPCGPDASHAPQCHNSFAGGSLTPCCPPENLDCTGKPDGYPGFGCTPGEGSFCSCTCSGGMSICGC